ncbi:MAG: chorismate mutase [Candidatus Limnocylindrales bacterium]|jgi:chorismate mutase/prephenate dehydratase
MTDGSKRSKGSTETSDLETLRSQIDDLDVQIVKLLNRRAQLGLQAGHAKVRSGRQVADSEREREVLVRVAMANDGPMPQDALLALYRQLIETIKRLEELQGVGSKGDSDG